MNSPLPNDKLTSYWNDLSCAAGRETQVLQGQGCSPAFDSVSALTATAPRVVKPFFGSFHPS